LAWTENRCPHQTAISIRILGNEVTVNEESASLFFFLGYSSDAGEGITVSDWCTKANVERLEPPAGEMRRQHPYKKCRAQRPRYNSVLKAPLLRNFLTHEALIDHLHLGSVALNVGEGWSVRQRPDFITDLDVNEGLMIYFVHTLLSLSKT
jgi:hypothetical protein